MQPYPLSTLHRTLIALSAIQLNLGSREQLLATHEVTEADLREHQAAWQHLQAMRAAKQTEFELPLRLLTGAVQPPRNTDGTAPAN